jgi:hypothetical protein
MPGGLLNLISYGNQNIYLNGNPSKTFFKAKYAKYTNFGLQKFRIDFEGSRNLRASEDSIFRFKIPRYADLLMDTYICVNLPFIWSPIYPPQSENDVWAPYEFKWVENLGCEMIREISITCGGQLLQRYSGTYLKNAAERDLPGNKKFIFNQMTGNTIDLNDPANSGNRVNSYPSAYFTNNENGAKPSIDSRKLYIPLNTWFTHSSKSAFPLVALQYNELYINVTFRPLFELFTIRDVKDKINNFPYIQPNFNNEYMQLHNFLQTPPTPELKQEDYDDKRSEFNADVHIIANYCFLSDEEQRVFSLNEQKYLIKEVHEYNFKNVTGSRKIKLDTLGMVANWMWFFQRNDSNLRNQWSNYTNWPYKYPPADLIQPDIYGEYKYNNFIGKNNFENNFEGGFGPGINPDGNSTPWFITGNYEAGFRKTILQNFAILLDGNYRENLFDKDVFNYIEKYARTNCSTDNGLFCYNFCLNNDPSSSQPSGGINLSKFKNIEFEFNTEVPTLDPSANFYTICDDDGTPIGVNKVSWAIYNYNYDLHVMEERYNMITFASGNCGLMYSR